MHRHMRNCVIFLSTNSPSRKRLNTMKNLYNPPAEKLEKAVAYYRSAGVEPRAIATQRAYVRAFARQRNIEIIHEAIDCGQGGLSEGSALQQLFEEWILNDIAPTFDCVLIYDLSRWGRSQSAFESTSCDRLCEVRGKH